MHVMESINRQTWRNSWALRDYRRSSGYLNEGERTAFTIAAPQVGRGRILDIGVGGGRTAQLLRDFASDYVGVDYTPEMVALCRNNHPDLRFEHMDARDLSAFRDESFDLVVFSYNGIDSVDASGRLAVLREAARVLAPGGAFVFSTFHRDWRGFERSVNSRRLEWANPVRLGLRTLRYVEGHISGTLRQRRLRPLEQRDGEHAIMLHGAHDFGIMVYATTPAQVRVQLADAGFAMPALILDLDGRPIGATASAGHEYFHVVAHKPSI
jgi:SAM-dependent methyltransferase